MHKNGEYRHFLAFGATLRDKDGTPLKEAGSWLDITERKKMERQIVDMNESLTLILDSMSAGIVVVRLEDSMVLYANKVSMDVFGCEDFERDVAGKSVYNLMPETQPDGRSTFDMATEFLTLDRVPTDFQCYKLSGELFTARITSCNITYKGKLSALAIVEDVTLQKQLEKRNERRQFMNDTLNKASVVFVSRNEDSFEDNMSAGISAIAGLADVDRLSVWKNFDRPDGMHASMVYRWDKASGGTTEPTPDFADVKHAEFAPNWQTSFIANQTINGPCTAMPKPESVILGAYGVASVFVVPVFVRNDFSGFVFFEDRKNERTFDDDCAYMLKNAAFLLVSAFTRHEAEIHAAEAESRAKLMLDTSPLCCQLWDKGFTNIDCNEAAVRLYGFKDKQEYLDRFFETLPEVQPDGKRSSDMAVEVLTKTLEEGSCHFNCMHRMPNDGSLMPAEINLYRVNYKGSHAVIGYTRDLREQNKIMAEIEYRDTLMRAVNSAAELMLNSDIELLDIRQSMGILANAMGVGRVTLWRNHTIGGKLHCSLEYEWSENMAERTGDPQTVRLPFTEIPHWETILSARTCINAHMSDIISSQGALAQKLLSEIRSILAVPVFINDAFWGFVGFDDLVNKRVFTQTEESLMSSGSLLITNAILRQEMVVNMRDTSAQLETALQAANEANRVKSVFLANMSHEIRTPMNSIMGFAELARDDDLSGKTRDYLLKISENADWMLHIINDILDISKIESGKIVLDCVPFDVHEIYEHCKSMIMPKVEEKGLALYCYAEPSVGKKLLGDPVRLRQVITNLLSNAVKFTNSGTIKLLASVLSSDENSASIRFEVKDSGIGMSEEMIQTIFDPFVQADDDTTRKYSGTGLGLAITKNLVELMGGSLEVVSAVGVGSKFSFEILFSLIDTPLKVKSEEMPYKALEKPVFKGEVLICEDNDMNQQVICDHLKRVGFQTVVAHNGQEGVDIVTARIEKGEKPFDLIFMDIHMPVMDGLEAALKISDFGVKTPVVALTANVMLNNLEMYKTSGMDGYLGKPFTAQDLYKCLMKYFAPLNFSAVSLENLEADDEQLLNILRLNFVKSNQTTFNDIESAISAGDIKLAHRLVHTLKSNAGNIHEKTLQAAAAAAEGMLKDKKNLLKDGQLDILGEELKSALEKYAPMLAADKAADIVEIADEATIQAVLERLESMLVNQNMECMRMVGDVRAIAGTEELVREMEDFEFERAVIALQKFRKGRSKK